MSPNDYIRHSVQKYHWYKYYSVMRPVSIGTHPKNGMMYSILKIGKKRQKHLYHERIVSRQEMQK